jgi:hypothetical protein
MGTAPTALAKAQEVISEWAFLNLFYDLGHLQTLTWIILRICPVNTGTCSTFVKLINETKILVLKIGSNNWAWWLMPEIIATWETKIRRIMVQGQSRLTDSESLSQQMS